MSESSSAECLSLRPVAQDEREALFDVLNEPRLQRVTLISGINQIHQVEWSEGQRTFAVHQGDALIGAVDLHREDDDPGTWELTVVLRVEGQKLGARAGLAGLFYAFTVLGADAVWFWAPMEHKAVEKFATRLGLAQLTQLKLPDGGMGQTYEIERDAWETGAASALSFYLAQMVEITDGHTCWRGEESGFFEL